MAKLETIHVSMKDDPESGKIIINKSDYNSEIHKIEKRPLAAVEPTAEEKAEAERAAAEKAEQDRIDAEQVETDRREALTEEEREAEDDEADEAARKAAEEGTGGE